MSRFPGMNPYLESQVWEDFHTDYIVSLRAQLASQLTEPYFALVEKRVYIERHHGPQPTLIKPDVAVLRQGPPMISGGPGRPLKAPYVVQLAIPERIEETFIKILRHGTEVVTVIELLSPTNKRPGADGRNDYLEKRDDLLGSRVHLVELDLLRGGERLPMAEPLPGADYYALVSQSSRRPLADVWAWTMPDPMPTIQVPLDDHDPPVELDLQRAFETTSTRVDYDRFVDYKRALVPPPSAEERAWLDHLAGSAPP